MTSSDLLMASPPSTNDRGLEGVDRRADARFGRHGEVLHLERNPVVVTHHADDGEEFLPPLRVMPCTDRDIVPGPVPDVGDLARFQQAVDIRAAPLDPGILAMAMVNRVPECARRGERTRT